MESVLKSDIFFFITSAAVIIIAALLAAILIYIIKVMRDVKRISRTVREEADALSDDVGEIRAKVKAQGFSLAPFFKMFDNMKKRNNRRKK